VSRLIDRINVWLGSIPGVVIGHLLIAADLALGLALGFSGAWSTANGAATGLVSISLLVLLQHSSNRGNAALHAKLDVGIAAMERAPNTLIGSEREREHDIANARDEALKHLTEGR
jgi:low affinity Fe/Cu permease